MAAKKKAKAPKSPKGSPENPLTEAEARAIGVDVDAVRRAAVDFPGGDFIIVRWQGGERVYSKEEHGSAYVALATEFAEKVGGSKV